MWISLLVYYRILTQIIKPGRCIVETIFSRSRDSLNLAPYVYYLRQKTQPNPMPWHWALRRRLVSNFVPALRISPIKNRPEIQEATSSATLFPIQCSRHSVQYRPNTKHWKALLNKQSNYYRLVASNVAFWQNCLLLNFNCFNCK